MSKSYNVTDLTLADATNLDWALAWVRFLAREMPVNEVFPAFSLEDEEWEALVEATAKTYDSTKYYLPWEAVAVKLLTDPSYATQVSEEGYSGTYRSAESLAGHLRQTFGRKFDSLYPTKAEADLTTISFAPRF